MSSIAERYHDTIVGQTNMRAVYPPNAPVQLGDFGTLVDGIFYRRGNLATLKADANENNIAFQTSSGSPMHYEFKSQNVRKTTIALGGQVSAGSVAVNAQIQLDFSSSFSVYVSLAGAQHSVVTNINQIGNEVVTRYHAGAKWWDSDDIVVVMGLLSSANTTVIVGQESSSKVILQADAKVPNIDLASVNVDLQMTYDSSSSISWITEKSPDVPYTPFCTLYYLHTPVVGKDVFIPKSALPAELPVTFERMP